MAKGGLVNLDHHAGVDSVHGQLANTVHSHKFRAAVADVRPRERSTAVSTSARLFSDAAVRPFAAHSRHHRCSPPRAAHEHWSSTPRDRGSAGRRLDEGSSVRNATHDATAAAVLLVIGQRRLREPPVPSTPPRRRLVRSTTAASGGAAAGEHGSRSRRRVQHGGGDNVECDVLVEVRHRVYTASRRCNAAPVSQRSPTPCGASTDCVRNPRVQLLVVAAGGGQHGTRAFTLQLR